MKMKNALVFTVISTSTLFSQSGDMLFNKNCAICHATVIGVNEAGGKVTPIYDAPYAKDIINKLKIETKTKEAFITFIKDYINEPNKRKSLYGKKAIKDFGLMPSLKGAMTENESTILAEYLYNDYGKIIKKEEVKKVILSEEEKSLREEVKKNEILFSKYCASCHATAVGVNESGGKVTAFYEAPFVKDVMIKIKDETKTKEAFIDFIKDYINEPNKRKSLYGKKAIKNFGLMPSLKGVMTEDEINGLADYLYTVYGK